MKNNNRRDFGARVKNFAYSFGESLLLVGFGIYALPTVSRKILEKRKKGFKRDGFESIFGYVAGIGVGTLILEDNLSSYLSSFVYRDYSSLFFPIFTNFISAAYETSRIIKSRFLYKEIRKRNYKENNLKISNDFTLSKFDNETIMKHS